MYKFNPFTSNLDMAGAGTGLTPPTISLSSPQAGLKEIGSSVNNVQLIANVTQGSNPIQRIRFYRGSTQLYEGLNTTYTDAGPFTTNQTRTASVYDGTFTETSNAVSITFVGRFYRGNDPNSTIGETEIEALEDSMLRTSYLGIYTFGAEIGSYKYFARPVSLGLVSDPTTKFIDNNTGFPIPFQLQSGTVTVTNSYGYTLQYYVYRSVNILGGSVTIRIVS